MSVHIIIDGYNLIRQSAFYGALDKQDLQTGREALLDTLAAYKRIKPHRITVVFDGANAPPHAVGKGNRRGIHIRFSHKGELADTVIKRMAREERERALVVSSDREVADYATAHGAAAIPADTFEQRIALVSVADSGDDTLSDTAGWVPTTKKKGPKRRLSKRERKNRTKIDKL